MIKVLIDLLGFLRTTAPLLVSLVIFTLLFILLAKSIKKHAKIYYIAFSIPFLMHAVPTILRWCGIEVEFSFTRIPILGEIIRDYIHMGAFGHPLLIIIMYMGALNIKNPYVKRLMSIRKELSIISGFPVFTHSLVRVANNFPNSLKYFTDHTEYMANPRVTSELGAGISSFSLVLGIALLALFIPLWITSFDSIHKRMGSIKWKKLQRWSYGLYAMLFIHAMGIQVGGMISRNASSTNENKKTEIVTVAEIPQGRTEQNEKSGKKQDKRVEEISDINSVQQKQNKSDEVSALTSVRQQPAGGGKARTKGFADFQVSRETRQIISIVSLLLIYGSYLFLRVRKAVRKNKTRNNF
ncbi:ferric reductase-like transmembrane domain-containing protein [Paludibacter sp. 221]|uniref:ferric reductase-like transmembrane domain-containing protein n=1 Tax=Paludibacter sp. 221 TaxID=2302939 RepID=UPI0013D419E0|nr:ferric reductase-like transmembrane domain-containing protein [Paludibacter sp. 221]